MPARSYNELIQRISNGFWASQPVWGQTQSSSVTFGGNLTTPQHLGFTKSVPNPLPTNVSAAVVTRLSAQCSTSNLGIMFGWLTKLGSLNLSTNGFSAGSSMPSLLELGVTNTPASSVIAEVKSTTLNASPGSIAITYVNQVGGPSATNSASALGASATYGEAGWLVLNAGDWGVRSISNAVQSGGTTPTGLIDLIGVIPLAMISLSPAGFAMAENLVTHHFNYLRLPAGAVIGAYALQNTGSKAIAGEVFMVGDS